MNNLTSKIVCVYPQNTLNLKCPSLNTKNVATESIELKIEIK